MPPSDDDRRLDDAGGRRASDDLERWRGAIEERVTTNTNKLASLNGDLRHVWSALRAVETEIAIVKGQVVEARADIGEAVASINKSRADEIEQLRASVRQAVGDHVMTKRDIFRYVVAPIIVALIAALIIYVLTHGAATQ